MAKKYIEELINEQNTLHNAITMDVDIEQSLFNLINNLINRTSSGIHSIYLFYYCSHLVYYLTKQTKDFDYYISVEKYLTKTHGYIDNLKLINRDEDLNIFKNTIVDSLGLIFERTSVISLSNENSKFFIQLVFNNLIDNIVNINKYYEKIKNSFRLNTSVYVKESKSDLIALALTGNDSIEYEMTVSLLKRNIDSFFNYILKFTTDVSAGKKIWKEVEDYINNVIIGINNNNHNILLEISIIYIFNKTKQIHNNNIIVEKNTNINNSLVNGKNNRIVLSSIFEFLCDKYTSDIIVFPHDINTIDLKAMVNNLNLFFEILNNHSYLIINGDMFNERYMKVK
jgi:hypothetical protein